MLQVPLEVNLPFIDGFVKACSDRGMPLDEIERQYRVYSNNALLSSPNVRKGFEETISKYEGPITKAAMAKHMTPEMLSLVVECRIKYGSDLLSQTIRNVMEVPDQTWNDVGVEIRDTAAAIKKASAMPHPSPYRGLMDDFDQMPLNQKVLLSLLAGASAGGLARAVRPNADDQLNDRGFVNRSIRGSLRGAGTGAGAAAGAAAGSYLGGGVSPDFRLPSMAMGGMLGGMIGHRTMNDFIS